MTFENIQKLSLRHLWHNTHTAAAGVEWNPLVSQNGQMAEAGRALWGHLIQPPVPAVSPTAAATFPDGSVQPQGWRLHLGNLCWCSVTPTVKNGGSSCLAVCAHCLCSPGPCWCIGGSQMRPFVCHTAGGGSKDQCPQLVWQTTRGP